MNPTKQNAKLPVIDQAKSATAKADGLSSKSKAPMPSGKPRSQPNHRDAGKSIDMQTGNEGEGSRTADLAYRKSAAAFVSTGQVGQRAKEAAIAVDGPEGAELRKAESKARAFAKR